MEKKSLDLYNKYGEEVLRRSLERHANDRQLFLFKFFKQTNQPPLKVDLIDVHMYEMLQMPIQNKIYDMDHFWMTSTETECYDTVEKFLSLYDITIKSPPMRILNNKQVAFILKMLREHGMEENRLCFWSQGRWVPYGFGFDPPVCFIGLFSTVGEDMVVRYKEIIIYNRCFMPESKLEIFGYPN